MMKHLKGIFMSFNWFKKLLYSFVNSYGLMLNIVIRHWVEKLVFVNPVLTIAWFYILHYFYIIHFIVSYIIDNLFKFNLYIIDPIVLYIIDNLFEYNSYIIDSVGINLRTMNLKFHRYIPVLMAQAKIYWDRDNYSAVEKVNILIYRKLQY